MKAFIISLSKIPSSYESALRVLSDLRLDPNLEVELFEGSYGATLKKEYDARGRTCHPWGLKGPERPFTEQQRQEIGSAGVIGCFDSHFRLWMKCIELDEPIMIVEDDIVFYRPYIPIDWEDVLSVAFSHAKKMARYQTYLDSPEGEPRVIHYGQSSMPGNGAYCIKPHAAKKLVEEYANSFLPADNAINQYLVKIQLHSHMMGRARTKHEGNISLIRTMIWNEFPEDVDD